jgi:hypothetical protein
LDGGKGADGTHPSADGEGLGVGVSARELEASEVEDAEVGVGSVDELEIEELIDNGVDDELDG